MSAVRLLALWLSVVGLAACTTTTTTTTGGEMVSTTTSRPGDRSSDAEVRKRARARTDLAAGYLRNGQYAVALEETRRAVSIDPGFADAYGMLGLIYMGLGERAQAEENFLRSLKLEPNSPDLNNNYGWYLCQTGREQESMAYFQRALADPLYTTPEKANQNAGICYLQIKDYPNAERYLRRAFEIDASNASTKYELARLYLATGRIDRAEFYYGLLTKSVEPSATSIWLGLRLARAQGNLRSESQYASELRQRYPSSPEAALLARGAFDE
jgi:type IV pilus assembly protein PilF